MSVWFIYIHQLALLATVSVINSVKPYPAKGSQWTTTLKILLCVFQERRVSRAEGLEYPINPSYDVTTHMYYDVANTILAAIKQAPVGKIQATFATHNGDTVEYVVKT